jgi:crotonobetainyl-CoA:carnitine CoA-transferase CaiB-like acyl-CoA transferase
VADGEVIVASGNDAQYRRFCEVLGRPALAADPAYATNRDRVTRRETLVPLLAEATRAWRRDDLLAALRPWASRPAPSTPSRKSLRMNRFRRAAFASGPKAWTASARPSASRKHARHRPHRAPARRASTSTATEIRETGFG